MPDLSRVAATNFRRSDGCRPENRYGPCPATTGWTTNRYSSTRPRRWSAAESVGLPTSTPRGVPFDVMRVAPREVAARRRDHVLGLRLELPRPLPVRRHRLRVSRHPWPGVLHQLVGPAPEQHRPSPVHQAGPPAEHLVVGDPLAVVATSVQRHVEREGQEAHGADSLTTAAAFRRWQFAPRRGCGLYRDGHRDTLLPASRSRGPWYPNGRARESNPP